MQVYGCSFYNLSCNYTCSVSFTTIQFPGHATKHVFSQSELQPIQPLTYGHSYRFHDYPGSKSRSVKDEDLLLGCRGK